MEAVLKKCCTAQLILTKVAQHSIYNTSVQVPIQFVYTCPIHAQSSANNVSISLEEALIIFIVRMNYEFPADSPIMPMPAS